jgi:hypothetical protein
MTSTVEFRSTVLNCGYNATGASTLFSIERNITGAANGERVVLNRCLVNVGDSTQRFLNENKIKLSTISTIVISLVSTQRNDKIISITLQNIPVEDAFCNSREL